MAPRAESGWGVDLRTDGWEVKVEDRAGKQMKQRKLGRGRKKTKRNSFLVHGAFSF